jgi:hypothetical protein
MFDQKKSAFLAAALVCVTGTAWSENAAVPPSVPLTSGQIVNELQQRDRARTLELKHYTTVRHYEVEYHGFSAAVHAQMEVAVDYNAASGKSFRIVSQSGPKFLVDKVLKRAVDSEKEAEQDKGSSAMNPANYKFQLAGSESVGGRPAYILNVEPRTPNKFLVKGKIWVDEADFAVLKMETEPSKSPSFWISKTLIHFTSEKVDGFWLPQQVRSETKVRIGGTAVLAINYGSYKVDSEIAERGKAY